MADDESKIARERMNSVVTVVPADHRYTLLRRKDDGKYLSSGSDGLSYLGYVDDTAVWDATSGGYLHPLTGKAVSMNDGRIDGSEFVPEWGPDALPSQYLESLIQDGHVAIPALLAPELCEELQQLAETAFDQRDLPLVLRASAGIKVSTHPVVTWIIKSYLRVDYKLAHSPGFAILPAGQGVGNQGGWHSDYPYHGGTGQVGGYAKDESLGKFPSEIPFGLQFNTCITEFTPENGGTCFRLGSRDLNHHPNWGAYAGEGASQFSAPAGTVILYDSRTWHRTGMNLTDRTRVALLNACIPEYIVPMGDQQEVFKQLTSGSYNDVLNGLTERERDGVVRLMAGNLNKNEANELMKVACEADAPAVTTGSKL